MLAVRLFLPGEMLLEPDPPKAIRPIIADEMSCNDRGDFSRIDPNAGLEVFVREIGSDGDTSADLIIYVEIGAVNYPTWGISLGDRAEKIRRSVQLLPCLGPCERVAVHLYPLVASWAVAVA